MRRFGLVLNRWARCSILLCASASACEVSDSDDIAVLVADTLVVDLSIGTMSGEGASLFGRIGGLVADSTGRIFVSDRLNDEIRVFDSEGAHVFSFGGTGAGPGELAGPCCLAWGPEGNLWVREAGNARYSVFRVTAHEAVLVRTLRLAHGDANRIAPITFRGGAEFADIGARIASEGGVAELHRIWRTLLGDEVASEVIVSPPLEDIGGHRFEVGIGPDASLIFVYQPYGPSDLLAHGPEGVRAEGVSSEYAVRVTDGRDVVTLALPVDEGPELTVEERRVGRDRMEQMAEWGQTTVARLPFPLPLRKPPLREAFFASSGNLWLERSVSGTELRNADVWSGSGELLARVWWPHDVVLGRPGWVGSLFALGVRRDSLGVEYVVRLSKRESF
jgi:6-bladed beta-propeller